MGFPDDGYDYLKHMRAPGRGGRANLEGAGPTAESAGHTTLWPRKHLGIWRVTSSVLAALNAPCTQIGRAAAQGHPCLCRRQSSSRSWRTMPEYMTHQNCPSTSQQQTR